MTALPNTNNLMDSTISSRENSARKIAEYELSLEAHVKKRSGFIQILFPINEHAHWRSWRTAKICILKNIYQFYLNAGARYLCADKIAPDSIYKTRTKGRRQKISALQQRPAPKAEIHYLENPALRHT